MSNTKVENIDNVSFGNMKITTTLNGGYDSDTPKEHKREVKLHFVGFDEASDDIKATLLAELAGKLRIKVNQAPPSGELKGRPECVDSETYAKMLDANDCEFTFDVNDLYAPSSRRQSDQDKALSGIKSLYAQGKITEEQYQEAVALVESTRDSE